MNNRDLPGYYFDEQKKKYFKIQANHLVPNGAKYAKGNVKREKRSKRKRQTEDERQSRREGRTIRQAHVLKSAVTGGIGLNREHGSFRTKSAHLMQVDNALVSQLQPHSMECTLPKPPKSSRLQDVRYMPEREQMIVSGTSASSGKSVLYALEWQWNTPPQSDQFQPLAAFNSAISTMSTHTDGDMSRIVACASQHQVGNVSFVPLPDHPDGDCTIDSSILLTIGRPGSSIGDSSIHASTGMAAIIGNSGIYIVDQCANVITSQPSSELDWPHCEPCINWLNPTTVLYGGKAERGHSVMLWDVRSPDARVARFWIRERLTGVFNPSRYGNHDSGDEHQIFASTNRRIELFDTRMPLDRLSNASVLGFKHIHGGPRLQRAAHGHFLAAVDSENIVQVYSTRSGTKISSLAAPEFKHKHMESPMFRQLAWYDDIHRGPTLQALRGNSIVRWFWGGAADDSDDELA